MDPLILVILGPTASGKSCLAIAAAKRLGGEIVNCDSMQMVRGMSIGTAKPTPRERAQVPHHLFNLIGPEERYSAGRYMQEAREICRGIARRRAVPVVVGGTGLYLRALLAGVFEGPSASPPLRRRLRERGRSGPGRLYRMLSRVDPQAALGIQPADETRIVRALEVYFLTGSRWSVLRNRRTPMEGFRIAKIGIDLPRPTLYARIDQRVQRMFEEGLVEEVRALLAAGHSPESKGFEALGYRSAASYLAGAISLGEAIERTQQDSRRYAKRQMTWFRKEPDVQWLQTPGEDPDSVERLLGLVSKDEMDGGTAR